MKALVFDKSKFDWETSKGFQKVDVPEPTLDESSNPLDAHNVIIKVHYAGVCGTDRGIWYRQAFRDQILGSIDTENKPYRIIGHEFFGEVVKLGSEVSRVKVGEFVSCESHLVCCECYQCEHDQKNVCTNEKILGISHDGCYAEFVKVPEHIIWPTDTTKIRPEVAGMQEPFGNAVHAASKVDVKGKTVAVFGLGPVGMFLTLILRGMGAAHIIGIEPNPVAQDMARHLGIDHIITLKKTEKKHDYEYDKDVIDEIMKITNGLGVDVSFEMAGFNSSVNNCLFATRRGGEIVLFGIKNGDFVFQNFNRLIVYGFTMHAVIGRELWRTWEKTRELLEDIDNEIQNKMYNVILDQGRDTILSIDDYTPEAFEAMMLKHPKILLQF